MKKFFQWALLAVALAGIGYGVFEQTRSPATGIEESVAEEIAVVPPSSGPSTTVTYFTTDVRCVTCRKIEALTQSALVEQFPEELASGAVVFATRNIDRPENKHFIDAYGLSFKTVVVSFAPPVGPEKWVRLDKVWELTDDPVGFHAYIADSVNRMRSADL